MPAMKLSNTLFALVIGIVLGVTAWAVSERSGGLVRESDTVTQKTQELAERARAEDAAEPEGADYEASGRTERMIQSGELSDHPAKFYRRDGGKRNRRRGGRGR